MKIDLENIQKGVGSGFPAGMLSFGIAAILLNMATGAFAFEDGLFYNLATFTVCGALFGALTGGIFGGAYRWLPSGEPLLKGIIVSGGFWLVLRFGGLLLSFSSPARYHQNSAQTMQGFAIAVLSGLLTGIFWKYCISKHQA